MKKSRRISLLCVACMLLSAVSFGKDYEVVSPDQNLRLEITINDKIEYSVSYQSKVLIEPSPISLKLGDGVVLGVNPKVNEVRRIQVDENIYPPVRVKSRVIPDRFNEISLECEGGYSLICRAYDDGVAYRFVTDIDKDIEVVMEEVTFNFAGDQGIYFPEEESFQSHSERDYVYLKLSEISDQRMCSLPALVDVVSEVR